ncbi:hypothetical protein [Mesobacillus jeotgali]|uniref:hypothetical protein n=1 Tax=Mesobacillus jeotgali TaxID=129985 RepID=UPI000C84EC62|nr:hypothetical protein [Mesobacillus jeotgali]
MIRVEFANVYTQETLREISFKDEDQMKDLINLLASKPEDSNDTYLIDSQFRSLDAKYVTHSTYEDNGITVYRLLFKVQLSEKQFKVLH